MVSVATCPWVGVNAEGLRLEAGEEDDTVALGVNDWLGALLKCSKWANTMWQALLCNAWLTPSKGLIKLSSHWIIRGWRTLGVKVIVHPKAHYHLFSPGEPG